MADYPDVFRALREGMTSLDGLASVTESDVAVTLPQPRSLPAAFVSPNYFDVLGVQPEIGRTFASEGGQAESAVAIIGHALWTREFGRDPSVVGRPIQVGGQIFQIVGVAPQGFRGTTQSPTQTGVELWLPIALVDRVGDPLSFGRGDSSSSTSTPGERLIRYVGRMRDGVRVDRVETELAVIAGRRRCLRPPDDPADAGQSAEVSGLSRLNDRTNAGRDRRHHRVHSSSRARDRLCQRREPPPGACLTAPPGGGGPSGAGRVPAPARPATGHREPRPGHRRCGPRAAAGVVGPAVGRGVHDDSHAAGRDGRGGRTRDRVPDGSGIRTRSGTSSRRSAPVRCARHLSRGERRHACRVPRPPGPRRRSGRALAGSAGHRVPVDVRAGIPGGAARHGPGPSAAGVVQPGAAPLFIRRERRVLCGAS